MLHTDISAHNIWIQRLAYLGYQIHDFRGDMTII